MAGSRLVCRTGRLVERGGRGRVRRRAPVGAAAREHGHPLRRVRHRRRLRPRARIRRIAPQAQAHADGAGSIWRIAYRRRPSAICYLPFAMQPDQSAYLYIGAFVDELSRAGVKHVCFCPGSRSAPLAMRLAGHPGFRLWQHLDERSAAFFALGMAKAQRQPVVLLCTSGTAAANFFPAVVEAHYACVPLVVLTADRPPELRDFGAPQTIDQIKMYGPYAKWFVEMALPEATADVLRYARTVACRAVAEAAAPPAGVVHLNFPFREPLVPVPAEASFGEDAREAFEGRADGRPYAVLTSGPRITDPKTIETLASELSHITPGLIIAGPQTDPDFPKAVAQLGAAFGYPILADPLSGVRCGPHARDHVIDAYDAFLRDSNVVERLAPGVILRFGAMPTSKPVLQYLQRYPGVRQLLVGEDGWRDAASLASDVIHADARLFCAALTPLHP